MKFSFEKDGRAFLPQTSILGEAGQAVFFQEDQVEVQFELRELFQQGQYDISSESGDGSAVVVGAIVGLDDPANPVTLSSVSMASVSGKHWKGTLDLAGAEVEEFLQSSQTRGAFIEFQASNLEGQKRTYQTPIQFSADGYRSVRRARTVMIRGLTLATAAEKKFFKLPEQDGFQFHAVCASAFITTDALHGSAGTAVVAFGGSVDGVALTDEFANFAVAENARMTAASLAPAEELNASHGWVYAAVATEAEALILAADIAIHGYLVPD